MKAGGYYYGHTKDLDNRLRIHNAGKVRSTKSKTTFILHHYEKFESKPAAYQQELFFRSLLPLLRSLITFIM